jgi:hypothetical protein
LKSGIGGSETAVIRLSEEWAKKGYNVVVYGDPKEPVEINGVTYLPWYYFNKRDRFNIFIQWRATHLAGKIHAKMFLSDMHDVYADVTHKDNIDKLDKFMCKSIYHREFGKDFPVTKVEVISNGIK